MRLAALAALATLGIAGGTASAQTVIVPAPAPAPAVVVQPVVRVVPAVSFYTRWGYVYSGYRPAHYCPPSYPLHHYYYGHYHR
jgi:hypothetical protein